MSQPSIGICIPTWNKSEETYRLAIKALVSIYKFSRKPNMTILVVDNDSPYKPPKPFSCCPSLAYIQLDKNIGYGQAINYGFSMLNADIMFAVNSDIELVDDAVGILIEAMDKYGLDWTCSENYESCTHYGLSTSDTVMGEDWCFGAFWAVRRHAWEAVKGFDPAFEMFYFEDSDLVRRLRKAGFRANGYRGTMVKHVGGASSHPERDHYFQKNRKLFEERWGVKYG